MPRPLKAVKAGGREPAAPGSAVVVMKQPVARDGLIAAPLRRSRAHAGRDRYSFHREQAAAAATRAARGGGDVADGEIGIGAEHTKLVRGLKLEFDLRVLDGKVPEPRHQPAGGERG